MRLERLTADTSAAVLRKAGVSAKTATLLKQSLADDAMTLEQIAHQSSASLPALRRLRASAFTSAGDPLHIVDVMPADGFVLSDTPFTLAITYQNGGHQPCVVANAKVVWAGDPFTVEADLVEQQGDGKAVIAFDRERTLQVGLAEFLVSLYRADGALSTFRRTVFVLPSNPLSLSVAPAGATVTGTWSARGDYHPENDTFLTEVEVTIAKREAAAYASRPVDYYEYEGAPHGPLAEAAYAERYLARAPKTPLAPFLHLYLAVRYRTAFETQVSAGSNQSAQQSAHKYRTYLRRAKQSGDSLVRAAPDDLEGQRFIYLEVSPTPHGRKE